MKTLNLILFFILFVLTQISTAQKKPVPAVRKHVYKGNEYYKEKKYKEARKEYDEAIKKDPGNTKARFNKGDALYREKKYNEAADEFSVEGEKSNNKNYKARSYHNMGNSYLKNKEYDKAIEAYKKSLRNNPGDENTRYNLSYALKKKEQQKKNEKSNQQKQNQNNQQDKNQNQQNKKDKEQKDKDKNNKDKQEKDKNNSSGQTQNNKNNKQEQPRQPETDRAKARQMLDAADENEKKLRAKIFNGNKPHKKPQSGKDW